MKFLFEMIGNIYVALCGITSLIMFSHIWLYSIFTLELPPVALMVVAGLILVVGAERLIDDLLRRAKIIEYIGDAIIIFFGAWLIVKAGLMLQYGIILIFEPDLIILTGETIVAAAIIGIGITRGIDDIIRYRRG